MRRAEAGALWCAGALRGAGGRQVAGRGRGLGPLTGGAAAGSRGERRG